jgi:hypothetical protein
MSGFLCPDCGAATHYRIFSGGREWICDNEHEGEYPAEGENLPRATLLRNGDAGATALRAQMDQELARLRDSAVPSPAPGRTTPNGDATP